MGTIQAIEKLENSNQGIQVILDHLAEQLSDMKQDPRLEGLMDDLESLFHAYLETWMKSNTDVITMLKEQ